MQPGISGQGNRPRTIVQSIGHYRHIITIVLACIAIALEIYYTVCAGSCSYLKGSIFGIDLVYAGIAYMTFIILLGIFKKDLLLLIVVSAGVGIEFYLIGFQVWYDTYCPYCLAFGGIVFALFVLNFIRRHTILALAIMALSLILFAIFFKGSLAPTYTYTFLR